MLYFDHAASTTVFPLILKGLAEKGGIFANPSSIHKKGQEAHQILDEARYNSAKVLEAQLENIIFTSGATEALNLAIIGHFLFQKAQRAETEFIIQISPLIHSAAWEAVNFLLKNFGVKVEKLPIDKLGFIDIDKINEQTLSKSFMVVCEHGNSEIGLLQPVAKLGKCIRKIENKPIFIVDTAASIVDTDISLNRQVCDILILSAEKFGGLKGAGILVHKSDIGITPLIGGSQELGYRGGTENLLGIWSISEALKIHSKERDLWCEKLEEMHYFLRNFFVQEFKDIQIVTPVEKYLPHIFHFILPKGSADIFVQQCDLEGLCISAGAACSSGSGKGSSVLLELGYDKEETKRGIRISFGKEIELDDVKKMIIILKRILKRGNF